MPYLSKGRNYTYGVKTFAEIDAISAPVIGETVFCSENNRMHTYDPDGVWMCCDYIKFNNQTGGTRIRYDIVLFNDASAFSAVGETGRNGLPEYIIGPVIFGNTAGNWMAVAWKGKYGCAIDETSVTRTDYLKADEAVGGQFMMDGTAQLWQRGSKAWVDDVTITNGILAMAVWKPHTQIQV